MEREDSDATQIKSNGWRQGSVLPAALVAILRENDLLPWELSVNNQAVRSHNAAVRTRRERIKNELAKLSRSSTTTRCGESLLFWPDRWPGEPTMRLAWAAK
jgi:hypothetical protein